MEGRQRRVNLNAEVRTRDGERVGHVERAIVDPLAHEISDFVISTGGFLGYDMLVPRPAVGFSVPSAALACPRARFWTASGAGAVKSTTA